MANRKTLRSVMQGLAVGAFAYIECESRDDATATSRSVQSIKAQGAEFAGRRFTTAQGVAVFYNGDPVYITRIEREA